jgi:predicted transcriptional regulator
MYNEQYAAITSDLSDKEKSLLVRSLDIPVTTIRSISNRLVSKGLLQRYSGISPIYYTTTDLGYEVASYIQNLFSLEEETDQETYDLSVERWLIVFEITLPSPFGSFMAEETFRDQVMVREAIEARAVSLGHASMRSKYQTASKITAVSREVFQLPSDIEIIQFS